MTHARLGLMAKLGMLAIVEAGNPRITRLEAHKALLDFYWPTERDDTGT